MELRVEHLTKSFGGLPVVADVSFAVEAGHPLVLLGPSGSGKTTLLRMISGVETPDGGRVWLDDREVTQLAPHRRDIAMVFQSPILLPHRTVGENLAYPLLVHRGFLAPLRRWHSIPKEIQRAVEKQAERLRILHLLHRAPSTLSGGELQRAALGRALIRGARAILLDEPLSNIDVQLRQEFRSDLMQIMKDPAVGSGTAPAVIWVTHDREDAFVLADRLGVLISGKLLQVGEAEEVYACPATRQVAQLVGWPPLNFLRAELRRVGEQWETHFPEGGALRIPEIDSGSAAVLEGEVTLGVHPTDVTPAEAGPLAGRVVRRRVLNEEVHLLLITPSGMLSMVTSARTQNYSEGDWISVQFTTTRILIFEKDESGGRRLR